MRSTKYFERGEAVEAAGLVVLRCIREGENQRTILYRVRYGCCGKSSVLSHLQIKQKARNERIRCKDCGNLGRRPQSSGWSRERRLGGRRGDGRSYGIVPPTWPRPGR